MTAFLSGRPAASAGSQLASFLLLGLVKVAVEHGKFWSRRGLLIPLDVEVKFPGSVSVLWCCHDEVLVLIPEQQTNRSKLQLFLLWNHLWPVSLQLHCKKKITISKSCVCKSLNHHVLKISTKKSARAVQHVVIEINFWLLSECLHLETRKIRQVAALEAKTKLELNRRNASSWCVLHLQIYFLLF